MKTSRSTTTVLISGGAVIALAVMLFLNGLAAQPANAQLLTAFALLAGLALVLLAMVARTGRQSGAVPGKERKTAGPAEPARKKGAPADAALVEAAGELRTTVHVIQEELEEILEEEVPADKEHMQALYDETDRLKRIIDSMEELTRAQALAAAGRREPVQIGPLLQRIMETTQRVVPNPGVTYRVDCEAGLVLPGDPECLERIIGNIADNAARSIRAAGTVTLTAARRDTFLVITVRDTGIGIRRAHLPHIFERFFRGTGTGIGMGLSIVKELVDASGGTIAVETDVNKGTTVTVELPAE